MQGKPKGERAKPPGLVKAYFANGQLESVGRYVAGKRHGPWKFYLRNGNLKAWGRLVAGQYEGMWKWNAENGTLRQWGPFKDGQQHGIWTRCFGGTGVVCDKGLWNHGKRIGLWKFYGKDGQLKRTKTFH
ncbi:MAG: hypothetical protein V4510_06125 [bacterium]